MLQAGGTHRPFAAIVFLLLAAAASPLLAADFLRTVALTGMQVPGAGPDARFEFQTPVAPILNNLGHTAFQAFFTESGINKAAVFTEGGGAGLRVAASARVLSPFPLLPFSLQSLNDQGQTAYVSRMPLVLTTGQALAIIRDNGPGDQEVVARTATPEESGFGFTLVYTAGPSGVFNSVSSADNGQLTFQARANDSLPTGDQYHGIWREGATGALAAVVRAGDPAPGTAGNFEFGGVLPVGTNRSGHITFLARATDGTLGIWSENAEGLQLRIRVGDAAPGAGGATIASLGSLGNAWNSEGQFAFVARLTGPGNNRLGLWSSGSGSLELLARQGDQAPGASAGQTLWEFNATVLNSRGDHAFIAATNGPDGGNKFGLWSDAAGNGLELIAYPGITAPGAGPGAVFDTLTFAPSFPSSTIGAPLVLNSHGQVAFKSSIDGPGVNDSNDSGIWAQDRAGILRLIARRGDVINVSDDPLHSDWRTISSLFVSGNSGNDDGHRSWFNDLGQLIFLATFTDGSQGLFVSDAATLPEPNAFTLLLPLFLAFFAGLPRARRPR